MQSSVWGGRKKSQKVDHGELTGSIYFWPRNQGEGTIGSNNSISKNQRYSRRGQFKTTLSTIIG